MNKTFTLSLASLSIFLGSYADTFNTPPTPFVPGSLNQVTVLPSPVDQLFHISGIWDINLNLNNPLSLTSSFPEALHPILHYNWRDLADKNDLNIDFGNYSTTRCLDHIRNIESWYSCLNNSKASSFGPAGSSSFGRPGLSFGFGTGALSGSAGGSAGAFATSGNGNGGTGGNGTGGSGTGGVGVGVAPPTTGFGSGVPVPEPFTIIILGGMTAAGAYLKYRKSSE